jgi:hypothetical protein
MQRECTCRNPPGLSDLATRNGRCSHWPRSSAVIRMIGKNSDAVNVKLTPGDLERAAAEIDVERERYPAQLLAATGR